MDILDLTRVCLLSPLLALAWAVAAVVVAGATGREKAPTRSLVTKTIFGGVLGLVASLFGTITWMWWYEAATGYGAGNAMVGWLFVFAPASMAAGQVVALIWWWFQTPRLGNHPVRLPSVEVPPR